VFDRTLVHASACAVILGGAGACGDVADVQVPLIPDSPPPRSVPELPRATARAFADIGIGGGVAACPLEFHSLLPSVPPDPSPSGASNRVVDGDGTRIECRVRERVAEPDSFDIALVLEHGDVPRFSLHGSMSEARLDRVALQIAMPDGRHVEAECGAEAFTIDAGAVSFQLPACVARADGDTSTGCSIEVIATFENCGR
jgi:hypothetical protein